MPEWLKGLAILGTIFGGVFLIGQCMRVDARMEKERFMRCVSVSNGNDADYAYFPPQQEERVVLEEFDATWNAERCYNERDEEGP